MPETRYIETYEQGAGKLLTREPYEVSDEELAKERKMSRMANILDEIDRIKADLEVLKAKVGIK